MGRSVKDATRPRSQRKSVLKGYENEVGGRLISQFPRKSAPSVPIPTVTTFSSSPPSSSTSAETAVNNPNLAQPLAVQVSSLSQQEQPIPRSGPSVTFYFSILEGVANLADAYIAEQEQQEMARVRSTRGRGRGAQRARRGALARAGRGRGLPALPLNGMSPIATANVPSASAASGGSNGQLITGGTAQEAGIDLDPSTVKLAKRLLPDATFPHFKWVWGRVWNEQDEQSLQNQRADLVKEIAKAPRSQEPELELWRIMIKLYDRIPMDLFRYGLRPVTNKITLFNRSQNSFNLPEELCRELSDLLCHPVWDGRLDVVRHALQLAVCHRVAGHAAPLGPLVEIEIDPLGLVERLIEGLPEDQQVPAIAEYAYRPYVLAGAHAHAAIQPIAAYLAANPPTTASTSTSTTNTTGTTNPTNTNTSSTTATAVAAAVAAARRSELYLFLLTAADVALVKQALESQRHLGQPRWQSCTAYRVSFVLATGSGGGGRRNREPLHPQTEADLVAWKAHCSLHLIREKQIRFRLRDEGRDDRLFDIPQRDPFPVHFMSERVAPDRFRAVTGEWYPPGEEPLPPRNSLGPGVYAWEPSGPGEPTVDAGGLDGDLYDNNNNNGGGGGDGDGDGDDYEDEDDERDGDYHE